MSDKPADDLEVPLEGWLDGLPAPEPDEAGWEARAVTTVAAAQAVGGLRADASADWLDAPKLDAEQGEPGADAPVAAGVASSRGATSGPVSGGRSSLKEMAERMSAKGPVSTPMPASVRAADSSPSSVSPNSVSPSSPSSVSPSSAGPVGSTRTPMPRAEGSDPASSGARPAVRRVAEADTDDSGFVDLKAVHAAATPEQAAQAAKAELGTADLYDDEPEAPVLPGQPASQQPASHQPANDAVASGAQASAQKASPASNRNTWVGLAIGLAGIAAAVAMWVNMGSHKTPSASDAQATHVEAPASDATGAAPSAAKPTAATEDEDDSSGVALSELDDARDEGQGGGAEPSTGALALGSGKAASPAPDKKVEGDAPEPREKGDLDDEMAKATGDDDDDGGEKPQPAAADPKDKSQNIPEAPPQGKVQAAIGSVLGGARACVAGGDDVSRATITFGSSGQATGVSVSGWAAGKGAAGCIKSALMGANVGRFSRATYTIGVTVRP